MTNPGDEENPKHPTNNQSGKVPDGIKPSLEKEANTPNQETENMEVHHHGHHEGKKTWRSYFWEFLMLFLAVFCGFLAEYKLEHVIEHNRAKEFAALMVNDLASDTAQLNDYRQYMNYAVGNVDSLFNLLSNNDPKDIPTGKLYYYGLFGGTPRVFIPNDATLQQMKGSGSIRYFTNKKLNSAVANYDQLCRKMRITEDNDMLIFTEVRKIRGQIFVSKYNEEANTVFRSNFYQGNHSALDAFIHSNPPVLTYDKGIFNQYAEMVRSRFLFTKLNTANALYQHATDLIGELKKEYLRE